MPVAWVVDRSETVNVLGGCVESLWSDSRCLHTMQTQHNAHVEVGIGHNRFDDAHQLACLVRQQTRVCPRRHYNNGARIM